VQRARCSLHTAVRNLVPTHAESLWKWSVGDTVINTTSTDNESQYISSQKQPVQHKSDLLIKQNSVFLTLNTTCFSLKDNHQSTLTHIFYC
jgi:hypothetical protein